MQEPLPFRAKYADNASVNGSWTKDTVNVGGNSLNDYIFSLAKQLQISPGEANAAQYGVMGVNLDANEVSFCASQATKRDCSVNLTTATIPDTLYSAGYIRSRSYSLYLDDVAAKSGSILFGGVDTAKFVGDLMTLGVPRFTEPGYYSTGLYTKQYLYLTSVLGTIKGKKAQFTPSNYSSTVEIDSGTSEIDLPGQIYDRVVPYLPGNTNRGNAVVLCKDADIDATLTFTLTGTNGKSVDISVPFSQFVVPVYQGGYNSTTAQTQDGEAVCAVAISRGSEKNYNLFGDPLFRSAYIYFNLDQKTISLAQASYDTTGSSITAVGPGPVPSLAGSAKPDSTKASTTKSGSSATLSSIATRSVAEGSLLWVFLSGAAVLTACLMV